MNGFKQQQIIEESSFSLDDSINVIHEIGKVRENELKALNINTVGELKDSIEKQRVGVKKYKTLVKEHLEVIERKIKWDYILHIPQYVFITEMEYKCRRTTDKN